MTDNTVVLGIGNVLWADEGFGPKALERMRATRPLPEGVELVDGGTLGLYLLPVVQSARHLLVFDSVDFAAAPGQILVLRDGEIPAFFGQRPLSLHQTGFSDVLAAAQLTDRTPSAITLVGVQLQRIDEWGGDLTAPVADAMDAAIDIGLAELAAWSTGDTHEP